jgi:two-component system sensor histidine kinase KdpD
MAETVLVCVTGQQSSQRLIHCGAALAQELNAPLLVLSVSGSGYNLLSDPKVSQALNDLYRLSGEVGAEMTMLHHHNAHQAICDFAKERGVTHLVLGEGRPGANAFVANLMRALPRVSFRIESAE